MLQAISSSQAQANATTTQLARLPIAPLGGDRGYSKTLIFYSDKVPPLAAKNIRQLLFNIQFVGISRNYC